MYFLTTEIFVNEKTMTILFCITKFNWNFNDRNEYYFEETYIILVYR